MNKQILILLFSIILIGCKPQPICHNITINNTQIEYRYNTTIEEVFVDVPGNCSNETVLISSSNNTCDISMIQHINRLESIIDKWALADLNITVNETAINETNTTGGNST